MKCPVCFVEMENRGTIHLMKSNTGTISIKAHAKACPNCHHIELREIKP